ncbi:hypothetical protein HFO21_26080 [Rhizobium laguerreae]|uniref:hypothetical protein n=1 Tax=Rhizobium laguerreae TaxID=1076926 RepID=UPI001C92A9A1|nr:hypothetical protein [Rhizobium laguerreae]MBY3217782.1 hypothetical protein [Rhizobium laguerreae]
MEFFRADKRIFQRGDTIETARQFEEMHPEAGKRLEVLMRERKPAAKPDRSDCLMLFSEEEVARLYHSKMTGGRLYKVQVDPTKILHEGDMTLLNRLEAAIAAGETPMDGIDRYWRGEVTETPVIEVLLISGVVLEEIPVSYQEKSAYLQKATGSKITYRTDINDEDYPFLNTSATTD